VHEGGGGGDRSLDQQLEQAPPHGRSQLGPSRGGLKRSSLIAFSTPSVVDNKNDNNDHGQYLDNDDDDDDNNNNNTYNNVHKGTLQYFTIKKFIN
jgi:hypothetical protein